MLGLYLIFAIIVVGFMGVYLIASRKHNIEKDLLKVLSVALFLATAATLFFNKEIAGALEFDGVFPKGQLIMIMAVEWFTTASVFVTLICSFMESKYLKKFVTLVPVAVILNLVLLQQIMVAWYGWDAFDNSAYLDNYRTYGFIFQLGLLMVTSLIFIINRIKEKDFKFKYNIKEVFELLITIVAVGLVSMPIYALQLMLTIISKKKIISN